MKNNGRSSRRRWMAVGLAFLPFVAGEAILRALGLEYPRYEFPIQVWNADEDRFLEDESALHRFDAEHFWLPREGARIPWVAGEERVSNQGFRGEDPDPEARLRVLVLGDSSTFGWGVAADETYAELLERRLGSEIASSSAGASGRDVQVLNGGVVGSTVRQGVVRLRSIMEDGWIPHVVVAAFGATNEHVPTMDLNDLEKQVWLYKKNHWLWRSVRWVRDDVRLVHLLSYLRDELRGGREAWLAEFARNELDRRTKLQAYYELESYERRVSGEDFERALDELLERARAEGARLVLLHMPRRAAVEVARPQVLDYDRRLAAFAERTRVPLVEAHDEFRRRCDAGANDDELFLDGTHPTAAGHQLLVELLCRTVEHELGLD